MFAINRVKFYSYHSCDALHFFSQCSPVQNQMRLNARTGNYVSRFYRGPACPPDVRALQRASGSRDPIHAFGLLYWNRHRRPQGAYATCTRTFVPRRRFAWRALSWEPIPDPTGIAYVCRRSSLAVAADAAHSRRSGSILALGRPLFYRTLFGRRPLRHGVR